MHLRYISVHNTKSFKETNYTKRIEVPLEVWKPLSGYSYRNAISGSTFVARRAGMKQASKEVADPVS